MQFQSTRPRGARPKLQVAPLSVDLCFNPRARGGRDTMRSCAPRCRYVSIHAPAGGATRVFAGLFYRVSVSIHAPAGGATLMRCKQSLTNYVSIHAPAGGATYILYSISSEFCCFNPRARGGRDKRKAAENKAERLFQSTRPRGARPAIIKLWGGKDECFNPRARGGRDLQRAKPQKPEMRFNPRARGGRDKP